MEAPRPSEHTQVIYLEAQNEWNQPHQMLIDQGNKKEDSDLLTRIKLAFVT